MLIPLYSFLRKLAGRLTVTALLDDISKKMATIEKVALNIKDKYGISESRFQDAVEFLQTDIQPDLKKVNDNLVHFAEGLESNKVKHEKEKNFVMRLEGLVYYARVMHKLFKQQGQVNTNAPEYIEAMKLLEDLNRKVIKLQNMVLKLKFLSPSYS